VNVITLNIHRSGAANQGRQIPWWMEKYILGYMATLLFMTIHEPDSVTLLKTSQSKHSTIRRSSLLRDLKRIKNTENIKGAAKNRELCECLTDPSRLNDRQHSDASLLEVESSVRDSMPGESAFLSRVVKEQLVPRMTAQKPVMLAEFEERFRRILKRIYRSLQQHEIREEILDERKRIMWQWQALATVTDRFLLIVFTFATFGTVAFFLVLPVVFRDHFGSSLFF